MSGLVSWIIKQKFKECPKFNKFGDKCWRNKEILFYMPSAHCELWSYGTPQLIIFQNKKIKSEMTFSTVWISKLNHRLQLWGMAYVPPFEKAVQFYKIIVPAVVVTRVHEFSEAGKMSVKVMQDGHPYLPHSYTIRDNHLHQILGWSLNKAYMEINLQTECVYLGATLVDGLRKMCEVTWKKGLYPTHTHTYIYINN